MHRRRCGEPAATIYVFFSHPSISNKGALPFQKFHKTRWCMRPSQVFPFWEPGFPKGKTLRFLKSPFFSSRELLWFKRLCRCQLQSSAVPCSAVCFSSGGLGAWFPLCLQCGSHKNPFGRPCVMRRNPFRASDLIAGEGTGRAQGAGSRELPSAPASVALV
jgi:hypothetical protein